MIQAISRGRKWKWIYLHQTHDSDQLERWGIGSKESFWSLMSKVSHILSHTCSTVALRKTSPERIHPPNWGRQRKWKHARMSWYRNFKLRFYIISLLSLSWIVHEQLLSFWCYFSSNKFIWIVIGWVFTYKYSVWRIQIVLAAWSLLYVCVSPHLTSRSRFLERTLTVTNVPSVKITLKLAIVFKIAWWEIHKKWSLEKDWAQFWWKFYSELK